MFNWAEFQEGIYAVCATPAFILLGLMLACGVLLAVVRMFIPRQRRPDE